MLLKDLVTENRVAFYDSFPDWESAVAASCETLIADGSITHEYVEAVIRCVHKFGPYIVFTPNVAMPHSQERAEGVNRTAISFMRVKKPVHFQEGNPEKDAYIFFTIAAQDHTAHLDNMKKLAKLLFIEGIVDQLVAAECAEDLLSIDAQCTLAQEKG